MSFDDFDETPPPLSEADIQKYFTTPVYSDEEMEEKFRDWEPMTNYRGQIIKAEHKMSKKKLDKKLKIETSHPMIRFLFKFTVKNNKTKFVSKVLMMYSEDHPSFDWAYGEQQLFLRAVGIERTKDVFVKLDKFIDKIVDVTFTENKNLPEYPNIKFIDHGVIDEMKKTVETFDDDISF